MKGFFQGSIAAIVLAGLMACSSTPEIESDLGIKGAPDWVNEGTQAVDNDDGRFIYGVAFAPPLNDESLQMSTADSRARAELARIIGTFVDSTLNDYAASSGDTASASIERNITTTTQTLLSGAKIKGHWRDKNTGNIYSFAEMDMKKLDDAISAAEKLSQSFKEYYSKNASANFERFLSENQ
ncbi:MAG: hypothetical protein MI808_01060 [Pseudomonadales bacterium]|nr:hypothetical protein [Pseudomonadales bacterium]